MRGQRIVNEQQNTIDALRVALQMEIDGQEFYTRAAKESHDELGKKLLTTLASEEDYHRQVFVRIYETIRDKEGWPDVDVKTDGGRSLRTIFASASNQSKARIRAGENELSAVTKARAMEGKTYDFYQSRKRQASNPAEKAFYDSLAMQEQQHNLLLTDYYEYLMNPAGWFVSKEHPSLE
jgi:rubrerythrin